MSEPENPRPKGHWVPSSQYPDPPSVTKAAPATNPPPPAAAKPAANGCATGCLVWAMIPIVGLAIILLIAVFDHGNASNSYPAGAQVWCRTFVKEELKAPSSAHFSDEQATGSGYVWTVTGRVESDNSFGVAISNPYTCTVQVEPHDQDAWTLLSMTGLEN